MDYSFSIFFIDSFIHLLDNNLITAVKKGMSKELIISDKYAEMFSLSKNTEEMKKVREF